MITQLGQRLWLPVALYSALGVFAALIAVALAPFVPEDFPVKLGSEAVDDILSILASSMLTVTTFSLATLVAAYIAVNGSIAPHAARLLVLDGTVRGVLATFVGAFIYSMVGIVALHTGFYGSQGRLILFAFTVVVLLLVVLAMLRWIGQLSRLGQTEDALDRLVEVVDAALRTHAFATAWSAPAGEPAPGSVAVRADTVGHVRNIDLSGLQTIAERERLSLYIDAGPGSFVHGAAPLLWVEQGAGVSTELGARLRERFTIGDLRTFDQDPRYGLTVLGEVAGRALSPGINDPGTARDVISRAVALLARWVEESRHEKGDARSDPGRVRIRSVPANDLIEDVFGPIARDGSEHVGVQVALQAGLLALTRMGDPRLAEAARSISAKAERLAHADLRLEEDRDAVARGAASVRE